MEPVVGNIIEIEIIHYCGKCGWHTDEASKYVDLAALISWTHWFQEEHKEICTGDIVTRCVW